MGNRKLVFGDCPFGKPLRAGERFTDIYWRVYVKHQRGWTGSPDKLSRATGFVSSGWNQAFISHVWSSGLPLTLDPASGVENGAVVTTAYNDFVVSTQPIGPVTANVNPVLLRRMDPDVDRWEVQIAADPSGAGPVWESRSLPASESRVRADEVTGRFTGILAGATNLKAGPMYFCRARQSNAAGEWSDWSPWHQPFFVAGGPGPSEALLRLNPLPGPRVELLGQASASYTLEGTADLRIWSRVAEGTSPTGWWEWPLGVLTEPAGFFRVR